jgi:glycosyltransferase involved in cell wall biosynthesis
MVSQKIFSIVIPAFNEEAYIRDCLQSLDRIDFPKEQIEIIVVDNGSVDRTIEFASQFNVEILSILNVKVGDVRNYGASHASGKFLVFLDSDCVVDSDWLNVAFDRLSQDNNLVLGGQYLMRDNPSWLEKYWVLNNSKDQVYLTTLVGGCIFICKTVFDEVKGFNGRLHSGEDSDLTERLRSLGYRVEIFPKLSVVHLGYPSKIIPFIKRQLWHSADYITNFRKSIRDKVFIITLVFIASFFAFIVGAVMNNRSVMLISSMVFLCAPAILSFKRLSRSKTTYTSLKDIFCIYLVDVLYLTGRVAGTLISLRNFLFPGLDKKITR